MKVHIGAYPELDTDAERRVEVEIDNYDVWNLDHTLALVILPALKKLKEVKHGSGFVDNEDVPEELHGQMDPVTYETDDNWFKRFDYVLDEMIWSFEQLVGDGEGEEQFCSGTSDVRWQPLDKDHNPIGPPEEIGESRNKEAEFYEMVDGPNHTYKIDTEGLNKHNERIDNGLRLFGKYYRNLWD